MTGQKTVICRMNSTLFDEVAKIILSGSEARIGFTGVTEMKVRSASNHTETLFGIVPEVLLLYCNLANLVVSYLLC